jgi:hypothetical protein
VPPVVREGFSDFWVPTNRSGDWLWRFDDDVTQPAPLGKPDISGRYVGPEGDARLPGGRQPGPSGPPSTGRDAYNNWETIPTAALVASVPRDAKQLYDRVRADVKDRPSSRARILDGLVRLSGSPYADARLRTAAIQAMSYLPDVEIDSNATTKDGRHAVSIAVDRDMDKVQYFLDPVSCRELGERWTINKDLPPPPSGVQGGTNPPHGTVEQESTTVYAIVAKAGDKP